MFNFVRRLFSFIGQSKVERLLRELLDERERLVMLLAEQVEFLRAMNGAPTATVSRAVTGRAPVESTPVFPDSVQFEIPAVLSDEADELTAMLQADVITQHEYDEAMARLQTRAPDSIIE